MEELVQDLTSALEESELKIEVDQESPQHDLFKKRRMRKKRPVINEDGIVFKYLETCSDESSTNTRTVISVVCDKRLSGSDTESGFLLPRVRRHRRRKTKRMETDTGFKNYIKNKTECCNSTRELNGDRKNELESGISASDDSNEDVSAQDGDDEMTDFFNEPGGSVCGIPSIVPWWEEDAMEDTKLKCIINGAMSSMSDAAQKGFHSRINRLPGMAARSIRRGRRRYKQKKTGERVINNGEAPRQEIKNYKRRKTDEIPIELDTIPNLPLPHTNKGHKMLVGMGWNPGEGLGLNGQGIQNPVHATRRPKRNGLGL
uniref:G patch domain-containing protein 2 n=1 Tax=Ciona intestinalis TaxID=7719 RepID=H2XZ55_CIOIN|nr:G patch domain-containing protein 2 [Ciona intestinalis]|eukprot:XP_002130587.1 G patch domain-containing protein 2 [Ciona intestinalis]